MNSKERIALRLSSHGLLSKEENPLDVLRQTVGIQAQTQSTAELNMALRTQGLTAQHLSNLYESQTIIRSWANRWTLHLFDCSDWELMISARQDETFLSSYYFGQKETSLKIIEDLTLLFAQRKRLSKPEIEDFIHQNFPEFSFESNATALYGILQSMTHQGLIYFDASKPHANYELISADKSVLQNAEQAIEELILRYLKGFTPAGLKDFVKWSGIRIARARKIWKKLELNEEEPVLLSSMERQSLLEKIEKETIISARFDSLLTGYEDKTWLTPENRIADMWTKNGLLMAPIIYDGQLVGKWYYKVTGNPITFLIDHWLPLNKGQLEEKLLPVAEFLKVQIKEIKYTEI